MAKSAISTIQISVPAPSGNNSPWSPMFNDARALTTIDLNGDGYKDLFLHPSYFNNGVPLPAMVLLNDGAGQFRDGTKEVFGDFVPLFSQSNSVFFQDFTNDARLGLFIVDQGIEILINNVFPGEINRFFMRNADGRWSDMSLGITGNPQSFNHVSSIGDINRDGNLDVIITRLWSKEGQGTFFYLGDGKGGFSFSTAGLPADVAYHTWNDHQFHTKTINYQYAGANGTSDLNNDGLLDLITGSYKEGDELTKTNTLRVHLQNNDGAFNTVFKIQGPGFESPNIGAMGIAGIQTADLDNDGRNEIVALWENNGFTAVQVLKNLGNNNFEDVTKIWLGSYLERGGPILDQYGFSRAPFYSLDLEDLNNDGKIDLFLKQFNHSTTQLEHRAATGTFAFLNDGSGRMTPSQLASNSEHFTSTALLKMTGNSSQHVSGMPVIFDVNNDGMTDTVFLTANDTVFTSKPGEPINFRISTIFGDQTGHVYAADDIGETVIGSADGDIFTTGTGGQKMDGGSGIDTLILTGNRVNYSINRSDNDVMVSDTTGKDSLRNIERIKFADITIALDIDGSAGQAYRLYQAAFDRKPDASGLGTWIKYMDDGHSLAEVSTLFQQSTEFITRYGSNVSTADFVTLLYQNVLHRAPDTDGFSTWTTLLITNHWSRADVLIGFSESTENKAALVGVMQCGMEFIPAA